MAEEGAKPMLANCYQLESILFGKVLQGCFEESEKILCFFMLLITLPARTMMEVKWVGREASSQAVWYDAVYFSALVVYTIKCCRRSALYGAVCSVQCTVL